MTQARTISARGIAAAAVLAAVATLLAIPTAGFAAGSCGVLTDAAGDVAGPLGTPRPTMNAGREIDITAVTVSSNEDTLIATVQVVNLRAPQSTGSDGAFYDVFFSIGAARFFAQAARISDQWSYAAGPAADGLHDTVPQEGTPVDGDVMPGAGLVRIYVPRSLAGSPEAGVMLEQIRAGAAESAADTTTLDVVADGTTLTTNNDWAGGPEGGRFLVDGACLPEISGAGERCLVAKDSAHDASAGDIPAPSISLDSESGTAEASALTPDPATEIRSVQMGSNPGTIVVEIGVASLSQALPAGADAERWEVAWTEGSHRYAAFAERRSDGALFGYNLHGMRFGTQQLPTTGSLDVAGGAIRILVPRHEIEADDATRFTSIQASSYVVFGMLLDTRDSAPNAASFATQFVAGVSCEDQQKAACPVVLDPAGDATGDAGAPMAEQPASDVTAAGISAPDGSLVMSARVVDIGAPPPAGFDEQGWTVSWVRNGQRWFAQASRTSSSVRFSYGVLGSAASFVGPVGRQKGGASTSGAFDAQAGVVRIEVPSDGAGSPATGETLAEVGVRTWIRTTGEAASGVYPPVREDSKVDDSPLAPYVVGLSCGA